MSGPRASKTAHFPQIFAAIDIGTNSVLLSIAKKENGALVAIQQRATVTRLGQGVDQTGHLADEAVERTLSCLRDYASIMRGYEVDAAHAVGTSALRDAKGGSGFVASATDVLGFAPEVITGDREAELTFRGALSGLSTSGQTFVFDIGGGSTELILGSSSGGLESAESLDMGSVRLTERCRIDHPVSADQLAQLRSEVRRILSRSQVSLPNGVRTIGVAGTVTTLAALEKKMESYDPETIHGSVLRRSAVSQLVSHLACLSLDEKKRLPGLSPGRADVIVAGSVICEELMSAAGADELTVSDRGVRFGVLQELAAQD